MVGGGMFVVKRSRFRRYCCPSVFPYLGICICSTFQTIENQETTQITTLRCPGARNKAAQTSVSLAANKHLVALKVVIPNKVTIQKYMHAATPRFVRVKCY